MSVSYDYYKVFYYVATYHSFNKAAAVLSNSQPNISRSISILESQLGCKLFNRSSAGVTLTEAGKELFVQVEAAFLHLSTGEDYVRSFARKENGLLRVGISVDLTQLAITKMVIPTIIEFRRKFPHLTVEIQHEATPRLAEDVGNSLLDIAFITTPFDEKIKKHKYHKEILGQYSDIFIAGSAFSNLKEITISLEEIMDYPIICPRKGTETYDFYKLFFADHGLEFRPSVESTGMEQVLTYTIENLGIGIIAPEDAAKALEEGKIFQINTREEMGTRYVAILRESSREKKIALSFLQIFHDNLDTIIALHRRI